MDGWQIVVNGKEMVDDIRKASDRDLSNLDATDDILQVKYTMHPHLTDNPYHIDVIRVPLTRNIGARFADVHDEVQTVISEKIPVSDGASLSYRISRELMCGRASFLDFQIGSKFTLTTQSCKLSYV
jgi:hypothetical protein